MSNPRITDGKTVEIALKHLAAIVESSDDAIVGKDLNGIITSWNKGAEKIFGYTADEMVGTSILRLFPPERHAEEDYILGKIRRGEKVERLETLRQTKDGRLINISVTTSPIKDAAGNIIGASKIARDITERKAHEQEILRLSRLYSALSQINQAIVWTRHRDELFEKICRVLVELGKFSMVWIGQTDAETRQVKPVARWGDKSDYLSQVKIYTDERPEGRGPVGTAIRKGKTYICNDFAQDPNTAPWHELANRAGFRAMAAIPIQQSGAVCGAVMVYCEEIGFFRDKEIALLEEAASDISFALDFLIQEEKRRQAEATLRESEERYKALFDRSLDCVFLHDFAGKFLDANQAALNLLGYQRKDIATVTFASLLTEEQFPLAFQVLEEIKTTGHQKHPTEYRLRGKDGRLVDVETQSSLIYREGKPFAIQGIARDITERKQAEARIHELAERQAAILNALPAHIALLDAHGFIVAVNEAWRRFASANVLQGPEFAVGVNYLEVCQRAQGDCAEEAQAAAAGIRRVLHGEAKTFNLEYPCHSPVEQRWFQLTVNPLSETEQTGAVVMHINITERKQAEEALAESEKKFSSIFESSPMAMALSTLDEGRYTDVNKEFLRMLQRTRDEVVGRTALELSVWPNPEQRNAQIVKLKEQGLLRNVEMEIRGKSGQVSQILWAAELVVIGGKSYVLGSLLDITERKQAEEAQARLATAVEQSTESILITDPKGNIVYVNPAFEKIAGYARDEALGQNPRILKSGKHDANFYRRMWDMLKSGAAWQGNFINVSKDGKPYEVQATISPVRDATGAVVNFVAVQRDVTREKQLEAQFRESQKMEAFGQLAGGVAHDFNNILAVIQLQAGLLKSLPNISLQQLELVGDIEKASQRAANLTRQLLLFSRKQSLQARKLKLTEVVQNISRMLKRTLGEQIELVFKFFKEDMFIHADPGMIDQILLNLTVNARDAMPRGGLILIETSSAEFDEVTATQMTQGRPGSFACLSVTDNGHGIPPEILPKIFEPFFTTKEVGKGTGLGLATVFGIVQQHKGWISVYSEVGRGTTFRVYLPRLTNTSDTELISAQQASIRGGTETILLVEDEFSLRAAVASTLSHFGYTVLEASTGHEALEVWKKHSHEIRLLLTDLVMPGAMTGRDLAVRLLEQNPKLKVIYLSGYSAEIVGKDFFLKENENFLTKPFERWKLAQIIRNNLD